jgi:periplasmic protein TonB
MFQSVIEQRGWSTGRLGTGMWVSVVVHAGLVAGVLALSARAVVEPPREPVLTFIQPPAAQPPRGNPNPPSVATPPRPRTEKPRPRKKELVLPSVMPPRPLEVEPPDHPEETPVDEDLPYIPGSHPDGVESGGVPGMPYVAGMALGNGLGASSEEETIPFGEGMTRPELLSGADIHYTREALAAGVRGLLIARCVITREGQVQDCRILKGLPYMSEVVLESLVKRRYRPVSFQGRPVNVNYTFNVRLELP